MRERAFKLRWLMIGGVSLLCLAAACAAGGSPDDDGLLCGDGLLDQSNGEECDDGNRKSGDGCSIDCVIEGGGSGSGASGSGTSGSGASGSGASGSGASGASSATNGASSAANGAGGASGTTTGSSGGSGQTSTGTGQGSGGGSQTASICPSPGVLTCSSSNVSGTTVGGPTNIASMGCNAVGNPGPEAYYTLTLPSAAMVKINLNGSGALDQDLAVVGESAGDCDPQNQCLEWAWGGTNQEEVNFSAAANTTYYIIVDTYVSNGNSFTITVTCT